MLEETAVTRQKALSVRYVKIHFTIKFVENTVMPINKASALRGGMGEMLLRMNCIRDRDCGKCDFETECLVRRIMYSQMAIQPKFMTAGDSVGYVLDCENYQEEFKKGEMLDFSLLLFGKTIVYFAQILDAFFRLGLYGIGKNHSRYQIISVTNTKKEKMLDGNDILMERYQVQMLADYVCYRMDHFKQKPNGQMSLKVRFKTPLSLKYRGWFLKEFDVEAIDAAIRRRIYILDCFEGISIEQEEIYSKGSPAIVWQSHRQVSVPRYSNRRNEKMRLWGIEGECLVENVSDEFLWLLLAGELTHIGKNTSFGFGRYRIEES